MKANNDATLWKVRPIAIGSTVLLIALSTVVLTSSALADEPAPNVVMLIGDDMGWTDYGFMGHDVVKTPNLDRLASEGVLFPNGYVPTSLCRASLATLLTGLYASQHKICCNDPPVGVDRSLMLPFLQNAPTIPRLLKDHGYRSLQTGKFWEGHFSNGGFTDGMTTKGRHGDDGLVIGRQTMQPIYDFISSCGKTPFFVWYAPLLPHEPHDPPQRILEKYLVEGRDARQARYWAMCEWFDETCGELVNWLDNHGHRDDTLFVYVVDNGWLQTNGPVRNGDQFLTRSKNTPYEDGIRTPIILRRPGWLKPGRRTELVSTIDLAPTILACCRVAGAAKLPGLNLLPLVREDQPLDRHDVFGEIYLHDCVELGKPKLSVTHRWIRHDDWKLIVPTKPAETRELYRVTDDPHEKNDLSKSNPMRVSELAKLLDQRWDPNVVVHPTRDEVVVAIEKSIPLLEKGSKGSIEQRKQCFNCHNQGLPIIALTTARSRGLQIDQENLARQLQFTADFLARNKLRYLEGEGQGGQIDTAGYALWTLDVGGWKPDETTAAVAEYFLLRQSDREYFRPESIRPPSEQSLFTSSYVALRGLTVFGTPEQKERIDARIDQVRHWLLKTPPQDTEDRVFRLRALHLIDAQAGDVQKAAADLLTIQRPDGGWSQLSEMESDAYATGTVLVALHDAGILATDDPRYVHGLRYLISSQNDDGSWHVVSRSKPIQTYFESGYPHGKDQFISIAAASWSTTALALSVPESTSVSK